jgi:spermidine/putrescine transport system substrate-binding protein
MMKKLISIGTIATIAVGLCTSLAFSEEKVLNFFNYSDYIPKDTLDKFTAETGIKVNVDNFDTMNGMIAKLKVGGAGYDVVVASAPAVGEAVAGDLLMELDHSKLPNIANLKPNFVNPTYDPGLKHSVPYLFGAVGFAYDAATLPKLDDSWKEIFEPRPEAQGKVAMKKDPAYVYAAAAAYLGIDACTESPADAQKILDVLNKQKPYVLTYTNDGILDRLVSGETPLSMFSNGMFKRAKEGRSSVVYVVPKEGVPVWLDSFTIPKEAPHPENALAFLNFVMKPEAAAAATNLFGFDNPVTGSEVLISQDLRDNPAVIMPPEMQARFRWERACSAAAQDLRDKVWGQLFR